MGADSAADKVSMGQGRSCLSGLGSGTTVGGGTCRCMYPGTCTCVPRFTAPTCRLRQVASTSFATHLCKAQEKRQTCLSAISDPQPSDVRTAATQAPAKFSRPRHPRSKVPGFAPRISQLAESPLPVLASVTGPSGNRSCEPLSLPFN